MKIWFDMDGTIANLYAVDGWLDSIIARDTRPYEVASPMIDTLALASLLNDAKANGLVTMPKGFYLTARYNGMMMKNEYYKTKTALNARVKELKGEGYILAK